MSIIAGISSVGESAVLLGSLLVAAAVFRLARAYKPETVCGPLRTDPAEPMGLIAGVTFAGFAGWMFASMAALSLFRAPTTQSTTTIPANLPPLAIVWTGIIGQLAGLVVLGAASIIFRPGGLGRLGLSPGSFRTGARAGIVGVCFVIPAMFCVGFGTEVLWRAIDLKHAKHELLTAMDQPGNLQLRLLAIFSAVVIAPVFEELLFRGHIQTLLRRTFTERREADGRVFTHDTPGRIWLGIIFASIAFMSVHPTWSYPPIFFLAICLGYIYERTGSLWAPIVVHALFNAIQTAFSLGIG